VADHELTQRAAPRSAARTAVLVAAIYLGARAVTTLLLFVAAELSGFG
jgi:hypothetical protein